jgi:hypothetical protein
MLRVPQARAGAQALDQAVADRGKHLQVGPLHAHADVQTRRLMRSTRSQVFTAR